MKEPVSTLKMDIMATASAEAVMQILLEKERMSSLKMDNIITLCRRRSKVMTF